jgi:hypothetical protein
MKMHRVIFLSLAQSVLLLGLSNVDDDTAPDSAAMAKFDFAHHCKVGGHTFRFETTTLAEIVGELGSGVIRGNGKDAGDGEYTVDYLNGDELIRFSSNAEMGGDDHRLGGVEVRRLSGDEQRAGIPFLRFPVTFQFGSVEMPLANLIAVLGPAKKTGDVVWYRYVTQKQVKVSYGQSVDYDISATLWAEITAGRVSAIRLWHVTSN